jgi:hypothetical protein
MSMPLFGAIEDFKRLARQCYKLMNASDLGKLRFIWDAFCTEPCTEFAAGHYSRCSGKTKNS